MTTSNVTLPRHYRIEAEVEVDGRHRLGLERVMLQAHAALSACPGVRVVKVKASGAVRVLEPGAAEALDLEDTKQPKTDF